MSMMITSRFCVRTRNAPSTDKMADFNLNSFIQICSLSQLSSRFVDSQESRDRMSPSLGQILDLQTPCQKVFAASLGQWHGISAGSSL